MNWRRFTAIIMPALAVAAILVVLTLNTVVGPLTCTYRAAKLRGTALNSGPSVVFVAQLFRLSSGAGACPKGAVSPGSSAR